MIRGVADTEGVRHSDAVFEALGGSDLDCDDCYFGRGHVNDGPPHRLGERKSLSLSLLSSSTEKKKKKKTKKTTKEERKTKRQKRQKRQKKRPY